MTSTVTQLNEFDLNQMVPDASILIIAKRGSGKKYIARDIANHFRHIPGGVLISPHERMHSFYKFFFPDLYIHNNIKKPILKKLLLRQSLMIEKAKKKKKEGKNIDPSAILIMDDCLAHIKSWAKDEQILEILMNGRCYRLTYILRMQTPLDIIPDLRSNFDYVFLLREDSTLCKEKLWRNYAPMFPTFESFERTFKECTKDYGAMIIDNRKDSNNIEDRVFRFKAKEQKFLFGSNQFKELHNKFYDPLYLRKQYEKFAISINNNNLIYTEYCNGNQNDTTADKDNNKLINTEDGNYENDNTCDDIDYLFDYFINEDKFNKELQNEWDEEVDKNFKKYRQPKADSCLTEKNSKPNEKQTNNNTSENMDHLFDYFINKDINEQKQTNNNTSENINKKPIHEQTNNNDIIQFVYNDGSYQFNSKITQLNNHHLVKILCDHIENLKRIKN